MLANGFAISKPIIAPLSNFGEFGKLVIGYVLSSCKVPSLEPCGRIGGRRKRSLSAGSNVIFTSRRDQWILVLSMPVKFCFTLFIVCRCINCLIHRPKLISMSFTQFLAFFRIQVVFMLFELKLRTLRPVFSHMQAHLRHLFNCYNPHAQEVENLIQLFTDFFARLRSAFSLPVQEGINRCQRLLRSCASVIFQTKQREAVFLCLSKVGKQVGKFTG